MYSPFSNLSPSQPPFDPLQNQPQQLPISSPSKSSLSQSYSQSIQNDSPDVSAWDNLPATMPQLAKPSEATIAKRKSRTQQNIADHEDIPYSLKVLLDDNDKEKIQDKDLSSTSSDSEETDMMPAVFPNPWSFGVPSNLRRNSEPFLSGISISQKMTNSPQSNAQVNNRGWNQNQNDRVKVKPATFFPLNTAGFSPMEKRAYFVTIQGFNSMDGKRIFKLDRLCSALPPRSQDETSFLYVDLWNDLNNQKTLDNIFEPSAYAIPCLQFRIELTVNMSHAYEDPYHIEFNVDLRPQAYSSTDRKPQGLEVVYADNFGNGHDGYKVHSGNSITIQVHLIANAQQNAPQPVFNPFKPSSPVKSSSQQDLTEFNVLLRQFFIRLPLRRIQVETQHVPIVVPQHVPRTNLYGKRGSAINLGQCQGQTTPIKGPTNIVSATMSPSSWASFTPEASPTLKNKQNYSNSAQKEPELPPGIHPQSVGLDTQAQGTQGTQGNSMFKFRGVGQHRSSVQVIKRDSEEGGNSNKKRVNRISSTDFSQLLGGDCSPMKIFETFVNAVKTNNNGNRRQSMTSEGSMRFQVLENDYNSQSVSSFPASSIGDSFPDIVPEEDETLPKTGSDFNDDFRIDDYVGRMFECAKTNSGCKALQKGVQNGGTEVIDTILNELGDRMSELMLDAHANYLVQTLAQKGTAQQRLLLLQKMTHSFMEIAKDKKGTHSLQTIVSNFSTAEEFVMVKNIIGNYVFELSMDSRANYVVQKLINTIPIEAGNFLYQPLLANFVQVATNSYGLLVLKQMMAKVEPNQALKQKVVEITCLNFEKLIQNPFGNYAIQYIIEYYPLDSHMIFSKILLKIIPYASQKISSNVIEKCLIMCDSQFRRRVVDEVLKNDRLGDLMKNKYGNFVTLQLLATSELVDKQRLMQEIMKFANLFKGTKYKPRWTKFVEENPMKINMSMIEPAENPFKLEEANLGGERKAFNAETLENVKNIWREMTKDEKNESPPQPHYGKKNFQKRQSFC